MPSDAPRGRSAGGFTLLELLVVVGVVSVLFGIGIGFLGRTTGRNEALAAIGAELRAAALTARAEGLPTEVVIRPGQAGVQATVQARVLRPLLSFHLDPDQAFLSAADRPTLGGIDEPNGRFGHARRPEPATGGGAGGAAPLLRWPAPPGALPFGDGFALRLDVKLEARQPCTLVRLGSSFELQIDGEGRLRARLQTRGEAGQGGPAATLRSPLAVPLDRWLSVELGADAASLWCSIDERELARADAPGELLQTGDDVFEVSPGDAPVPGIVDEIRILVFEWSTAQYLPIDVVPTKVFRVAFDARGAVLGAPAIELDLVAENRHETLSVGPGGVLE
jgi:prepilin-type N-terminal cleavage/methylation domain-containing protein